MFLSVYTTIIYNYKEAILYIDIFVSFISKHDTNFQILSLYHDILSNLDKWIGNTYYLDVSTVA